MKITRLVVLAGDDVEGMLQIEQQLKRQHPDTIVMKSLPDEPLFIDTLCVFKEEASKYVEGHGVTRAVCKKDHEDIVSFLREAELLLGLNHEPHN
jgi:hypothetical protein